MIWVSGEPFPDRRGVLKFGPYFPCYGNFAYCLRDSDITPCGVPLAGCFTFLFYSFLSLFSLREIYSPFPGLRRGVFSWRNHIGLDERQKKRRREELSVFCISFVCFMSRLLFFSSVLLCTTPRHHLKRSTSFPTMKATVCNSLVLPRLPCFLINCVHCG